jgi:hypothetical protein
MTDFFSQLLRFLFAQDRKDHPMPPAARNGLLDKIKAALDRKEAP